MKLFCALFIVSVFLLINPRNINAQEEYESCALKLTSAPEDATVIIDGIPRGKTPLLCGDLTVGTHILEIRKEGYLSFRDTVIFSRRMLFIRDVKLLLPGTIHVQSTPGDAVVYVDDKQVGRTPLTVSDLFPGLIRLRLMKPGYATWEQSVVVTENKTSDVSIVLKGGTSNLTLKVSPEESEVYLNETLIGTGSLLQHYVPAGKYQLRVRGGEANAEIVQNLFLPPGADIRLQANLNQFTTRHILASALLPGLGQINDGATMEGTISLATFGVGAIVTLIGQLKYSDASSDYDDAHARYAAATTENDAFRLHFEVVAAHDKMKQGSILRNIGLIGMGIVYAYSVIEATINHSRFAELSLLSASTEISPGLSAEGQGWTCTFRFPF